MNKKSLLQELLTRWSESGSDKKAYVSLEIGSEGDVIHLEQNLPLRIERWGGGTVSLPNTREKKDD
jgi:hypothetical protein